MIEQKHKKQFNKLVSFLRKKGYSVKVTHVKNDGNYLEAIVNGRGIRAGFCTPNGEVYTCLNGKIAADNKGCFDKWSKCPFVMKIDPCLTFEYKWERLLKCLHFLGSKDGYDISNEYLYLDENPFPCEED